MEIIGIRKVWTRLDGQAEFTHASNSKIRGGRGFQVGSYLEMAEVVAELHFRNSDQVLLFRGQHTDFKNRQKNSTLLPTIFRSHGTKPQTKEKAPTSPKTKNEVTLDRTTNVVEARYNTLIEAEKLLIEEFEVHKPYGRSILSKHRMVRWSILQHYDVCATPLLDVTHSLRIAASFACLRKPKDIELHEEAYLYVIAIPNLSGGVTVDAASGTQIIRLSSVCPPAAKRPHIQEGYLLAEYPGIGEAAQLDNYDPHQVDFGRRLIAKLRFNPGSFWAMSSNHFPQVPYDALYLPDELDEIKPIINRIKEIIKPS